MYGVITIARECGSGGGAIARTVAERLGWELLDKNLVRAIARAAQVDLDTARQFDERVDSWWHRMNRAGLWAAALAADAPSFDAQIFDADTMAALAQRIILDAAARGGCVIVGRGAQCLLQNCPEALHVFVYAPWRERTARVQVRMGAKNVEELVRSTDEVRGGYIRRYFGCNWKDPHLYRMMINSELGRENVVRLIVDVVESAELSSLLQSVKL